MRSKLLYKYFTDDDFLRISNKIQEMEKITSGEIRVSFKESKPTLKKNTSIRSLAEKEFAKLGMTVTRDKTGILIFVLLKERQFYILADSGINKKVEQTVWDSVRNNMQNEFKNGNYLSGVLASVEQVGKILSDHFPIKADDTNELSNKVVIDYKQLFTFCTLCFAISIFMSLLFGFCRT